MSFEKLFIYFACLFFVFECVNEEKLAFDNCLPCSPMIICHYFDANTTITILQFFEFQSLICIDLSWRKIRGASSFFGCTTAANYLWRNKVNWLMLKNAFSFSWPIRRWPSKCWWNSVIKNNHRVYQFALSERARAGSGHFTSRWYSLKCM